MPWVAAAIGAAGAIGSSLINKKSADKQAGMSAEELAFQRDAFNRQFAADTDPVTDSYGTKTTYVPGEGWRTVPGPLIQPVITGGAIEQRNQLDDAQRARTEGLSAALRRRQEGQVADQYLAQLGAGSPYGSPEQFVSALRSSKRADINDAYDGVVKNALRQNLRAGGGPSSSANIIAKVGQRKAQDFAKAGTDALVEGNQAYEGLEGARTARLGNVYGALAGRATNVNNVPFAPTQLDGSGLAYARANGQQANPYGSAVASSLAQKGVGAQGSANSALADKLGIAGAGIYSAIFPKRSTGDQTTDMFSDGYGGNVSTVNFFPSNDL